MVSKTDEEVIDMLSQAGRQMSPAPQRLASALKGAKVTEHEPQLLIISTYMSSMTKVSVALVAVLVVLGGGYYLSTSTNTNVAMTTGTENTTPVGTVKNDDTTQVAPSPTAATDSFDDFAAAMSADAQAQQSAVASTDQSANAAVTSSNTVTSSAQPYDPSSI